MDEWKLNNDGYYTVGYAEDMASRINGKSLQTVSVVLQTSLSIKNGVFWVVTPCGSCKNRRFGGTWRLLHQGDKYR
jgi:hypothetical protein